MPKEKNTPTPEVRKIKIPPYVLIAFLLLALAVIFQGLFAPKPYSKEVELLLEGSTGLSDIKVDNYIKSSQLPSSTLQIQQPLPAIKLK